MTYILGGWQSDFARNWAREGMEIADGFSEVLGEGLASVDLEPGDIDVGHVGNFVGELFAGQGLLGGFFAQADAGFDGMPTSRHEAACASGSLAILAACADIESGRYGTAAVLGLEMMRNVPGVTAAAYLGAAAWTGHEFGDATYVWPRAFSDLTDEYDARYGIDERHLRRISEINFGNAKTNPNAQTRSWGFTNLSFTDDDEANPVIEGRVRKTDCGQVTDGAAMIVLASPERAADYARRRGVPLDSLPRILGWGHRSAPISYRAKVEASAADAYVFPQVRRAIEEARSRAGLGLDGIDAVETHDCFSMTEYMAIDHLGLTAPGESWKAIEAGDIEMGGKLPINPSGGLIGCGHPVGATGVRMALDAFRQTSGTAGDNQVEGARTVQTLNIGGSTTTTVSLVIGVEA
ncbi:MAG: acetyl-CoA acetyltransferase [Brevundimonas sp.]|uniref:acetyl-CoA acetyltransferase n=1 Tax=Brevundimonas sp. TaxID=1871086 RepID=UPI0027375840|nr:acetyl-CoA acetyltransferase [Brevundimonas sp.]MDP3406244.1 acetyl-CoA acetyltransferase [Brevundimonas sp.]